MNKQGEKRVTKVEKTQKCYQEKLPKMKMCSEKIQSSSGEKLQNSACRSVVSRVCMHLYSFWWVLFTYCFHNFVHNHFGKGIN